MPLVNRQTETVTSNSGARVTTYSYNDQNRLTGAVISENGTITENDTFTYDNNVNQLTEVKIASIKGVPGTAKKTQNIYDDLNQLASYDYDEFGNMTKEEGTFDNPYRYAGYQYDSTTKDYYLMSRMYDPETGRFLQEDTYRGDPSDALSLNLYTYCHNEPMMYDDPTGHIWRDLATDDAGNYVFSNGKSYTNHPEVKNAKAKVNELEKIARQKVNKNSIGKDYIEGFVDHFKNYLTMANEFSEHPVKTIILLPYQTNPVITGIENDYVFYEQVIMGDKHTRAKYAGDFSAMLLEMYLTKKVGDGAGKLFENKVPSNNGIEDIKGGFISEAFDKASVKLGSFGDDLFNFFRSPGKKPGYIKYSNFFNKKAGNPDEFAEITLKYKEGMPVNEFNRKANALKALGDQGLLFKAKNPVLRDPEVTRAYRQNMIKKIWNQYGETNPLFANKLIDRITTRMQPDHVWELQLGGPDTVSNLKFLDSFTNWDIGTQQIYPQIKDLPSNTRIKIKIVK